MRAQVSSRFVAAGLAVLGLLLAACGGDGGTYPLLVNFPSTLNLYEGNAVTTRGVRIGTVGNIRVDGNVVRVELRIEDDYPVPQGVTAHLSPQALLGEFEVELTPMWTEGEARMAPGDVVPLERTAVPASLDETLRSLRDLLTAMEPETVGRLVDVTSEALEGRGQDINGALASLSRLADTVADEDDSLGRLTEHYDAVTEALAERDRELGHVIESFAVVSGALAEERDELSGLVTGLANFSRDAADLLTEHRETLEDDIVQLVRLLQSADANRERIGYLNYAFRQYAEHIYKGAYREDGNYIDARITITQSTLPALRPLLEYVGFESICVPVESQQQCEEVIIDPEDVDPPPNGDAGQVP